MVTEKNLHNGLVLCCEPVYKDEESLYIIQDLEKGILFSNVHNKLYEGYSASTILNNIRDKKWFIYNKTYELW